MLVRIILFSSIIPSWAYASVAFPTICDMVNTPFFLKEVELRHTPIVCPGPISRPCVNISYYVPTYFIEVVSNPKETMFAGLPGVMVQLSSSLEVPIFGAEDDNGSYSYHAHVIHVPLAQFLFAGMPCGGGLPDLFCFSAMSEHLGSNWKTGLADNWHPQVLGWAFSPQGCLLKGAVMSISGDWGTAGGELGAMCSVPMNWIPTYPPTNQPVCTGWGIHFPRTGTTTSSDQTTASLMIASRIKSLGGEVFRSVSSNRTDKWQMIYPQTSSSFREGQNVGSLFLKGVSEIGRLQGRIKNYLYVIWQQTSCIRDVPFAAEAEAWLAATQATCKAVQP